MYPQQHFPAPGKSPFMDMQLVAKYAEEGTDPVQPTVQISQGVQQNLGVRLATVSRGRLQRSLQVSGVLAFDERDFSALQARTAGFVERTYGRATGMWWPKARLWRMYWLRNGLVCRKSFSRCATWVMCSC
jgi:Cu(I)/Ag(I) efflux system membrane fusion protein